MVKLIGALCVIFAGTAFGFFQANRIARRPAEIRQFILALQRLETEILYGFTPLAEALRSAGRPLDAALSRLFLRAADRMADDSGSAAEDIWIEAVEQAWPHTAMKASERDIVRQLGYTLGISDREDQIKHLRLAVNHLQAEEQAAADDRKRYEKMWKSLGLLGGSLAAILMY